MTTLYVEEFTSDRPIETEKEDTLGRIYFARRLAEVAALARAERGLVIGLVAPWGEGKSSVLELARSVLLRDYQKSARVVEFNPWLWSGTGQLVGQFFGELTRVAKTERESWAKIAPLLERYGELLSSAGNIPGPQSGWVKLTSGVVTLGGKVARRHVPDHADLEKWRHAIRDAITKQALSGLPRLVVVMDDLDRLLDSEIRDVAQLVKLTADFPHTVYILAYDRLRVEKALTSSGDGRSYLEKIVQIPLTLPSPDPQSLRQVVEDALSVAIRPLRAAGLWERGRWNRLYRDAFRGYLRTLRDAKRFANGLLVSVIQIGSEVDGVDLVSVTALRIFAPDVYDRMRVDRDLFVPRRGPGKLSKEERLAQLNELLEPIEPRRRELARAILADLFPQMEATLSDERLGDPPAPPRIGDPDSYWRYFALALTPGQIPDTDLRALQTLALSQGPDFDAKLKTYLSAPTAAYVVNRLLAWASAEDELDLSERLIVLARLLANWERFPRRTPRSVDHRGRLLRHIFAALSSVPAAQRAKESIQMFATAPWQAIVAAYEELDDWLKLSTRGRAQVHEALVARVRGLSDAELLSGPAIGALDVLESWGSDHEGRLRAERLAADDASFVALMRDAAKRFTWNMPSPKLCKARATVLLQKGGLSEDDQATLQEILHGIAEKAELERIDSQRP